MKLTAESTVLDDKKIGDSFATLQVEADGIRTEVGRKVGNDEVISRINQSPESIQIQANKVAITGTTVFNAVNSDASAKSAMLNSEIEVGGRNLLRDTNIDNGIAVNIIGDRCLSYGEWHRESLCVAEYVSDGDYLKIASGNVDAPTTRYGVYQDVVIEPNTDYVLSLEKTTQCHVGYQFTGTSDVSLWPADNGNWTIVNGRWSKVIRTNESTHNRCRIYCYATYSLGESRLQRIKFEKGNKPTDWTPAPEDAQTNKSIHTLDSSYNSTYQQLLNWTSPTYSGGFTVASTVGVKAGDTCRIKATVSDMNGALVYMVVKVNSVASSTIIYATGCGLDTTVIDGGHILTGTIDANRIKASVISAVNNGTGKIDADKINVGAIDIGSLGGTIGGTNLVRNSINLASFTEESRSGCPIAVYPESASITHTVNNTSTLGVYYEIQSPEVGAKYTLSFDGTAVSGGRYSVGGAGTSSMWTSIVSYTTVVSGRNTVTFTVPSGATSLRVYFSVNVYNSVLWISHVKLEKGSVATDWSPSPYDIEPRQKISVDKIRIESSANVSSSISGDSITMTRIGNTGTWGMYYDFPCEPNAYYTVSAKVEAKSGDDWNINFGIRDQSVAEGVSVWSGLSRTCNYAGVGGYYISTNATKTYPTQKYIRIYFCSNVVGASWTISDITVQKGAELARSTDYITHIDNNGIRIHPSSTLQNSVVINASGMEVFKGGTGSANSVAFYGDTARVGKSSTRHIEIKDGGIQVYADSTTVMGHFGYGSGNNRSNGTSTAPYFTLGKRGTTITTVGNYSVAEGDCAIASGYSSHAEGSWYNITSAGLYGPSGTYYPTASGVGSHAEGEGTLASYSGCHAEGILTVASGLACHAEGEATVASVQHAHAEGNKTQAISRETHAEGYGTVASGDYAHAEGCLTTASGECSHAGGYHTTATRNYQTVIGKYNSLTGSGTSSSPYVSTNAAFIIGNGVTTTGKDIFTVDWSGNVNIPSGATYKINGVSIVNSTTRTTFTPASGANNATFGGSYYERYGNVVHVHVGISGLTANTETYIYALPDGCYPSSIVYAHGTGGAWNTLCHMEIRTNGRIYVRSAGTYCGADATFII